MAPKDQRVLPFKKALLHVRSLKLNAQREREGGASAANRLPTNQQVHAMSPNTTGGKGTVTGWAPVQR